MRAKVIPDDRVETLTATAPGILVDDRLTVACGTGYLRLMTIQRAGRAAMPADAFLRGYPMPAGTRLG